MVLWYVRIKRSDAHEIENERLRIGRILKTLEKRY